MKIAVGFPPFESRKGIAQLSQNRQFQWTASGPLAYSIYPVILASAATMLKEEGYEVIWLDGIAESLSFKEWKEKLRKEKPDLLIMETKTPVVKKHWQIIREIKKLRNEETKVVLVGDHVTALPKESFENSLVDYVLTGGDYDFLLLNLANHLTKKEKLEPGIWYRSTRKRECRRESRAGLIETSAHKNMKTKIINTGKFTLNHNLNDLPIIDRELTKWRLYAYRNSNFYRAPGAYTMFGRDCWWGKCTFCSWTTLFPGKKHRVISAKKAILEVKNLVENYHVKEIMDDSGTFPVGEWLREFCQEMIKQGYHEKVRINGNMRLNSGLKQKDYHLMKKAGFCFLLYGLESANQETLDKINKNLKVEQVEPVLKMVKKAGLWPHLTVMIGYPWEGKKQIKKTVEFVKKLAHKGLIDSMQPTLIIPYPGTPLFDQCQKENLLKTHDWNRYDMREAIMKSSFTNEKLFKTIRNLYHVSIWNKTFLLNTIKQLKNLDGLKYVCFQALKYLGKLTKFSA